MTRISSNLRTFVKASTDTDSELNVELESIAQYIDLVKEATDYETILGIIDLMQFKVNSAICLSGDDDTGLSKTLKDAASLVHITQRAFAIAEAESETRDGKRGCLPGNK